MKKVKVTTSTKELETFLERTDIDIIKTDIRGCEQSWFAQEYFVATIYYDDEPKKEDTPNYWEKLLHQYAGMAMQGILTNPIGFENIRVRGTNIQIETALLASEFAHALVEKLKN